MILEMFVPNVIMIHVRTTAISPFALNAVLKCI